MLRFADRHGLALQLVVVTGDQLEHSPLAMAYDGTCRLHLALRNSRALGPLMADVPDELFETVAEASVAHEIGHCWRHVSGTLHQLPPFDPGAGGDPALAQLRREMGQTRHEEAFADLVALAWVQQMRPQQYERFHRWLERMRRHPQAPNHPHDTRAWLRLAADPAVFAAAPGNLFERALAVWARGLQGH